MLRIILGALAGYAALFVFIFVTLTLAWMIVGGDFAFEPGTTDVTAGWIAINLPLSFLGALVGGWVARRVGLSPRAVYTLAAFVLILGFATAFAQLREQERPIPPVPPEELSSFDAATYAQQPDWYNFVIPIIGVVGVMIGGARSKI